MFTIYRSIENEITHLDKIERGAWVNIIDPIDEEITYVYEHLNTPIVHLKALWMKKSVPGSKWTKNVPLC